MTVYLRDAMNTIYLTRDYVAFVESFLNKVLIQLRGGDLINDGIYCVEINVEANKFHGETTATIDIANTRFVRDVWSTLVSYVRANYPVLRLVDSEDAERNRFVTTFYEELAYPITCDCKLPVHPGSILELGQWVQELNEDLVYDGVMYNSQPAFLLIIQLLRPSIKMVVSNKDVFKYGRDVFSEVLANECEDFLYVPTVVDEYWDAHVDADGNVEVVNVGKMSKADFLSQYDCIPAVVGEKMFSERHASPAWKKAVTRILTDVKEFLDTKPVTIATYFKEELDAD